MLPRQVVSVCTLYAEELRRGACGKQTGSCILWPLLSKDEEVCSGSMDP